MEKKGCKEIEKRSGGQQRGKKRKSGGESKQAKSYIPGWKGKHGKEESRKAISLRGNFFGLKLREMLIRQGIIKGEEKRHYDFL